MANFTTTQIRKVIAKAQGSFAGAENREGTNSVAKLMFVNESSAFQNAAALKESLTQPTEAILQKKSALTLAGNKAAAHTGSLGDAFTNAITYVQKSAKFKVSYKVAENNNFGYQEQLNQGLVNAMSSLRGGMNAYAIAQLAALKTQVATGGLLTWDGVNFKFKNTAGDANIVKQASRIKASARKNKYGGALDVVGGQQLVADLVHNSAQGTANATNYGYQFGGLSIAEDETIDEATLGANGFGYFIPSGLVGMTSWNEPINRSGEGEVDTNQGMFTTIADPMIAGLTYDVHIKRGLSDTSDGVTTFYQDVVDEYEVTAIYSLSHAMISTANETPIFAFEQL